MRLKIENALKLLGPRQREELEALAAHVDAIKKVGSISELVVTFHTTAGQLRITLR